MGRTTRVELQGYELQKYKLHGQNYKGRTTKV